MRATGDDRVMHQATLLARRYGVSRLVLFGLRARGDHTDRSDYDLAVFGCMEKSRFNLEAEELDTLHRMDIVHVGDATSSALIRNIEKEGVVLMDRASDKKENFRRALERLKEACRIMNAEPDALRRDGMIQRFEFTMEIGWRAAREYLLKQGYVDINSPKSVLRTAFQEGLIVDEAGWLDLLDARNQTAHIYDESVADSIANQIENRYLPLLESLLEKIG